MIAWVLGPVARGAGWPHRVEELAGLLLQALELDGWEVTRRGDRFASLEGDARQLRIPLRGRCGICTGPVHRDVHAEHAGELLVGPWRHVDRRTPHRDDAITGVVAP